jgi:MoaA/NifB/PqqE/SkfB family radical SAM enzyme
MLQKTLLHMSRLPKPLARLLPLWWFKRAPSIVIIDVTNSCNLRCPVCPVTFAMHRKRGMMSMEVFKTIIDDFKGAKEKPAMYFNFSGEPTINPALPNFIEYAHQNGHETFLSTNATKLTRPMCERLIKAGLGRVYLCMDGFSKEAQEVYRVRSDFDAVKANIEMFLDVRDELGVKNPFCVLQTLLTSYSENQVDDLNAWASEQGFDQIRLKTFSLGSYTSEDERRKFGKFLPIKTEYLRHPTKKTRQICLEPLIQTVVFWNGDLGLCCIDYDQMIQLPNLKTDGFLAAYRSDDAARARKKGYLKQFDICKECSYSNAENMGFKINLEGKRTVSSPTQPELIDA